MSTASGIQRFAALVAATATSVGLVLLPSARADAGTFERIDRYDVDLTIEQSGALLVHETIAYDFGSTPHHGIFRDIPVRVDYPPVANHDRVYPLDVLSVRASEGTPAQYEVSDEGDDERIKIGDPDTTITGVHTYDITYRVRGAMNGFADHDELVWNAVGTEWSVPIVSADVMVHAPADILNVNCAQGETGSNAPCGSATFEGASAHFVPSGNPLWQLGPFEGMTVSIAIPGGVVATTRPILEERFTFASAFRMTTATSWIAGLMLALLIAAVIGFVWWFGRDRRYRGSAVDAAYGDGSPDAPQERVPLGGAPETPVEFVPPDHLRPGQVGTLVDFQANPLDVTATIVDLAVRGYLSIEEVDAAGLFRRSDWELTRKAQPDDRLLAYEKTLLDGLFRDGDEVKLSDLHDQFAERMSNVRDALTKDAISQGWFAGKPGVRRGLTLALGVLVETIGIAITVLLAIFTHAALIGIPIIVAGVVLMIASHWMPYRTAKGYAMLRHVDGFKRFIDESEKQRAQFAEKKNLFSEYLPYAVVFGATKKWAHAFAGLGDEAPDTSGWYVAQHPLDYAAFSGAISSFSVTSAGTLTSSPSTSGSSGFSGGGFSGGGGGGGGGGSW
ncbi:MAG TPA: DUF2207 domain-containing protein [Acidimicrobiia bacterium]